MSEPTELALRAKLHSKMNKIRAAISHIEKSGENKGQGYKYATEADTAHAIRSAMIEHNVSLVFSSECSGMREIQGSRGPIPVLMVKLSGAWVDCETGYADPFSFDGEGMDSGDKAIYKAHTGAEKYLLLKTFLIPTGDDPEKDSKEEKEILTKKVDDAISEKQKTQDMVFLAQEIADKVRSIDNLPHLNKYIDVISGKSVTDKGKKHEHFGKVNELDKDGKDYLRAVIAEHKAELQKPKQEIPAPLQEIYDLAKLKGKSVKGIEAEAKCDLTAATPKQLAEVKAWLESMPSA